MTAAAVLDRAVRPAATALAPAVVDAYLGRLGVGREAPSPAALTRLHRAHVERVPYETIWLHLGEELGIDPARSARHLASSSRGGYCFHLNGAFAELLEALGYAVSRHVAGVHDAAGPAPETLGNHVALVVHDLATDDRPVGDWYVDVGLGDVLHAPLPLEPGRYRQGPSTFTVERTTGDGIGDWHVGDEEDVSRSGVSIVAGPVAITAFAARHTFNTTSPASNFTRTLTCQRRHAGGADVLRGRILTRRDGTTRATDTLGSPADLLQALGDVFGLRLAVSTDAVQRLWARMSAAHEAWAAQRTATS